MKPLLSSIIAAILLTACAHEPMVWVGPATNLGQIHMDYAACRNQGIANSGQFVFNAPMARFQSRREKRIIDSCMEAKGYYLIQGKDLKPNQIAYPENGLK